MNTADELARHPRWITLGIYQRPFEARTPEGAATKAGGFVPDLDDPATAGVLLDALATVARETGRSGPHVSGPGPGEPSWGVEIGDDDRGPLILGASARTLGEAAGRVLLRAWS